MKKFDLKAAKNGAKVVTRDGREVRILCFDREHALYPIVGLINNAFETTWTETGVYMLGDRHMKDLMMKSTKRKGWVNVYPNNNTSDIYMKKGTAKAGAIEDVIDTVKIKWQE